MTSKPESMHTTKDHKHGLKEHNTRKHTQKLRTQERSIKRRLKREHA